MARRSVLKLKYYSILLASVLVLPLEREVVMDPYSRKMAVLGILGIMFAVLATMYQNGYL